MTKSVTYQVYVNTFSILLILFLFNETSAQSFSGFNNFYQVSDTNYYSRSYSLVQTDNGFISGGLLSSSDDELNERLFLFEVNSAGEGLWTTSYNSDSLAIYASQCRITRMNDSIYEWVCTYRDTIGNIVKSYPAILRFNSTGQIIDTVVLYLPDTLVNHNPYVSIRTSDGGLLIGYSTYTSITDMLVKVNQFDQVEWIKEILLPYPMPEAFIESLEQLSDNSYLVSLDRGYHTWVVVLSTEGVVKWWKTTGGPLNDNECYAIEGFDSTILMVNIFTTEDYYWWHEPVKMKFEVTLFDFSGNIIWRKLHNEIYDKANVEGLLKDSDSTFVFFGNNRLFVYNYMYRISSSGDSLLFKNLQPNSEDHYSYVQDGILTPDGALVLNGYGTLQTNGNYYNLLPWIIKTDWYGCYEPLCDSTAVYIDRINSPDSICKANKADVSVLASGPHLWYNWQFYDNGWFNLEDNWTFSGTTNDTLHINSDFPGNELTLRCIVGNEKWHKYSPETTLYFMESPTITQNPLSTVVTTNDNVQFTVTANGEQPLTYSWYFNNSPVILSDSNVLVIKNVSPLNTGYYYCTVTNECGVINSDTVRLDILSSPDLEEITSKVIVYPNPGKGDFNLIIPEDVRGLKSQLLFFNQQGIQMDQMNLSLTEKVTINNHKWPSGMYYIKILTSAKILYANFMIVQ